MTFPYLSVMVTVPELRQFFADQPLNAGPRTGPSPRPAADHLAHAVVPKPERRDPASGWTNRCVWYESSDALMAVVGPQERRYTDIALAHGLYLRKGRRLVLVLPANWAGPTLRRLPWLDADVEVHVYGPANEPSHLPWNFSERDLQPRPAPVLDQDSARALAGSHERSPALHLGQAGEWVRELLEWATKHHDLQPSHLRNLRAWSHRGQRVLTIQGGRELKVSAGIDAATAPARRWALTGTVSDEQAKEIKGAVEAGIRDAQSQRFGPFEEHHLQALLRQGPGDLALESPVLREVPAWRPAGPSDEADPWPNGRGFIDLVGLDPVGDVVLVETKLAADDMLVLQGLDYFVWATQDENRGWLVQRLHADPKKAKVRLLYAVGGRHGQRPVLSKYTKAHLDALDSEINWRLALLQDWDDPEKTFVELLPSRTR